VVSEAGTYYVTVTNECGNTASDTITLTPGTNPVIDLQAPEGDYFCAGEEVNITAEVTNTDGSVLYRWLDADSEGSNILVDTTKNLTVEAINEDGCKSTKDIFVEFQFPYNEEKILLSTYDPSEDKNIVIFSKTRQKRTRSYAIYSGNTDNDLLGYTDFQNKNLYVDQETDPYSGPGYYNLRVVDSCDNLSMLRAERGHRTIFLEASSIEDRATLLEWNKYLGFPYEYFYIYRGTEPEKLQLVDSIPNDLKTLKHSYIDRKVEQDVVYYYSVRVKTPQIIYLDEEKKAGSGPFVHSLSNLEDNIIKSSSLREIDYIDNYLRVYPNPVSENSRISYKIEQSREISFLFYDITGKEIYRIETGQMDPGEHELFLNTKSMGLKTGIFILKMEVEEAGSLMRKLVSK
jgi:hypothetical protein